MLRPAPQRTYWLLFWLLSRKRNLAESEDLIQVTNYSFNKELLTNLDKMSMRQSQRYKTITVYYMLGTSLDLLSECVVRQLLFSYKGLAGYMY